jgi:D-glycerate 3-kinase
VGYCRAMDPTTHPACAHGFAPAFVERVLEDALLATRSDAAPCYGITGLQGSGKTTLSHQVAALAAQRGRSVMVLSIDDFYLDRPERESLACEVHPLLATRGPPGTHDVALACATIDALSAGESVCLPRFDKLADRRMPESGWPQSGRTDLVILEGWFNQVPPQTEAELATPVNALEREEDTQGTWRRYCDTALGRDYPALWQRIDRSLFLQGPGFEVVPAWRWQQEQTLQAANPGRHAMTQAQVLRFVQFFERISRQAMVTLPGIADVVVRLDGVRRVQS